ncbi:class II aldolase/adducin family protein [Ramlibacter sp. AN1015]|uniref:class II aldolase/adducin family protein n=1 Tax=Ramlibacter sp. AN1015 TaxID=3133428 RepID=UPI0030BDFBEC
MPDAEWVARVELAACYRLVARAGMDSLIYNHITARVPGSAHHFLINPYGMLYGEITASSLLKVDLEGRVLTQPDARYGINHAGFIIHSAIHAARPDVACVLHTHTRAGIGVACQRPGLLPLTQNALRFLHRVAYHDFEGPAVEPDERTRLVADLGTLDVLVLRSHGLLTCGRSVPEAFLLMHTLEFACRLQMDLLASGAELVPIPPEVQEKTARVLGGPGVARSDNEARLGDWNGRREWEALLRQLDREDPSYRN